jgi:hypothetical protein
MNPLDTLLASVPGGGRRVGGQYVMRCPAHQDKRPSLAVRERDDGVLLIRCHAGCPSSDVLDALGLSWSDLYPDDARW